MCQQLNGQQLQHGSNPDKSILRPSTTVVRHCHLHSSNCRGIACVHALFRGTSDKAKAGIVILALDKVSLVHGLNVMNMASVWDNQVQGQNVVVLMLGF